VQDTEAELVVVKKNIQVITAGLEGTLDRHTSLTNSILDELTSRLTVNRSEVDTRVDKLDKEIRQIKDTQ
jgi:hypothetical protein